MASRRYILFFLRFTIYLSDVHRPGGLKRADWDFFFMFLDKSFFSQSSWYILVNEKLKTEKIKSRPPDWLFWQSPGGQETIFYLRMALYAPPGG